MTKALTEDQIQESIFNWLALAGIEGAEFIHAIPNGGLRHIGVAMKLKRTGVKKGVLDIAWNKRTSLYTGFDCEIKRPGNRLSEDQKKYGDWCLSQGRYVCLCYSLEEFQAHLMQFLEGGKFQTKKLNKGIIL